MKWKTRLSKLTNGKTVSDLALAKWRRESHEFNSCAVGERRALLESVGVMFDGHGIPQNYVVRALGYEFDYQFLAGDYVAARKVLDVIDMYIKGRKTGKKYGL